MPQTPVKDLTKEQWREIWDLAWERIGINPNTVKATPPNHPISKVTLLHRMKRRILQGGANV